MILLASILKRKIITTFFIFSYTFAILTFSVGNSAITSEKLKTKNFNINNNQIISFVECNVEISSEELLEIIKDCKVSVTLFKYQDINGNNIEMTTELKSDGYFYSPDMKIGEYFTKDDFKSSEEIAVFSPTVKLNDGTLKLNTDINLKSKGVTYERAAKIIMPYKLFFDYFEINNISNGSLAIIINGSENSVNLSIHKLNEYVNSIDANSKISSSPYTIKDVGYESNILYKSSFFIILITIINSISISSLWVEEMKNEIVLRKVFGARDSDIFKTFFLELAIISIIAMLLSMLIQWILSLVTGGYIFNIDLRLHFNNVIYSFILAIVTAFGSALPAFKYLVKVQPANILRED